MSWSSVNPSEAIKELKAQIKEIEEFLSTGKADGKRFYSCKVCGKLCYRVANDYGKEGYCSDCFKKKKESELKEVWKELIGYKITDFEIEISEVINADYTPRLSKLVLEKDSKQKTLKAEEIQHFIL